MKYIVTSSLNTDNILSTETISPLSFYKKRNFGYEIFYSLPQLDYENHLILFSNIPTFQIEDTERENHPLVLQIDDEEQLQNSMEIANTDDCKIFAFSDSIRLNPINCKLLFFSDKAKVLSRQNCMDSKLNKLINYYKFETINASNIRLEDLITKIDRTKLSNTNVNFRDNLINRTKGFICGYYIGFNKEMSPETADVLSKQKRVYDIVSSKLNNSNSKTDTELLDKELHDLDKYLSELSKGKIRNLWEQFVAKHNIPIENLTALLKDIPGAEASVKTLFTKREKISLCPSLDNCTDLADYRSSLENYVRNLIWQERKNSINLSSEIKVSESYHFELMGDDNNTQLFNFLIDKISEFNLDELRTRRFEKVNYFGKLIKEFFEQNGHNFAESPERKYFASLAENIRDAKPFNLHEIDNIILQSLAAFILKGEDLKSLVDYLAIKAIPTYKYSLAFWGAALGYVGIARPLLEKETKMAEFFPQVWKLITSIEMNGKLEVQNQPIISEIKENIDDAINIEESSTQNSFIDMIFKFFEEIKKGLKNQKQLENGLRNAIQKNGNNTDKHQFLNILKKEYKDDGWAVNKSPWKRLHEKLFPTNNNTTLPLELPVGKYFYCDPNIWYHIEPLINDKKAKTKIQNDLKWFQEDVSKPKELRKYYKDLDEKDNYTVISKFCRLKSNDKKGKPQAQYFTEELRTAIENRLKELYN